MIFTTHPSKSETINLTFFEIHTEEVEKEVCTKKNVRNLATLKAWHLNDSSTCVLCVGPIIVSLRCAILETGLRSSQSVRGAAELQEGQIRHGCESTQFCTFWALFSICISCGNKDDVIRTCSWETTLFSMRVFTNEARYPVFLRDVRSGISCRWWRVGVVYLISEFAQLWMLKKVQELIGAKALKDGHVGPDTPTNQPGFPLDSCKYEDVGIPETLDFNEAREYLQYITLYQFSQAGWKTYRE